MSSFSVKHLSDVVSGPNNQVAFKFLTWVEFSGCIHFLNKSLFNISSVSHPWSLLVCLSGETRRQLAGFIVYYSIYLGDYIYPIYPRSLPGEKSWKELIRNDLHLPMLGLRKFTCFQLLQVTGALLQTGEVNKCIFFQAIYERQALFMSAQSVELTSCFKVLQ